MREDKTTALAIDAAMSFVRNERMCPRARRWKRISGAVQKRSVKGEMFVNNDTKGCDLIGDCY